jgi:hypothetical protein
MPKIRYALKALRELGPRQLGLYARYKTRLRLGRLGFSPPKAQPGELRLPLLPPPDPDAVRSVLGIQGAARLLAEAEEIVSGQVRLFGKTEAQELRLAFPGEEAHWTAYERGRQPWGVGDVKFIWEPARFGWSFTLARAYLITQDERYPQAFWEQWETFTAENPPYKGQNWTSAQEAALRLIAFVFAAGAFASSPASTEQRRKALAYSIAYHAGRIPPTLDYARAQHNNHLLTEAAGLYTAALALPHHPHGPRWWQQGKTWFERGVRAQFTSQGVYAQHSTNYQRLALQTGLWMSALAQEHGDSLAPETIQRLGAGTSWLLALLDPTSGEAPNLGPNDGSYILPIASQPFADYRPVLQAAGKAFCGKSPLEAGAWDEMSLWLAAKPAPASQPKPEKHPSQHPEPVVLRGPHSWAYLRAAWFTSRPGHADQLHLDLWWRGINIARDAGTYLYNAPPPWDNALAHTAAHNTVTIEGLDQMTRAGRFLYLDWAQARVLAYQSDPEQARESAVATHTGYEPAGVVHVRSVQREHDRWTVEDLLMPSGSRFKRPLAASLHWLLPDGEYRFDETEEAGKLSWRSPWGWVTLSLQTSPQVPAAFQIVRAGTVVHPPTQGEASQGEIPPPYLGWASPTYGTRLPALALGMRVRLSDQLHLISRWEFPEG